MATAGAGRGDFNSRNLCGCAGIFEHRPTILHNRVAPQKNFNAKFFDCYAKNLNFENFRAATTPIL